MAVVSKAKIEIDPGTPDNLVGKMRLKGRMHARQFSDVDRKGFDTFRAHGISKHDAREWWLGWTDERFRRFFGRK